MIIDKLIDAIAAKGGNPSVIGLDTCVDYLPEDVQAKCTNLSESAKYIRDFNFALIDTLAPVIPAVKVQVAYYEQYGVEGMAAFRDTLAYAKEKGIYTIADCKRNDIGSTAAAYARAYLEKGAPFEADFVTVNGYLGTDGVKPFVDLCAKNDKGIFVLVKTSNPASGELQDKKYENGKTLYDSMADLVDVWGSSLIGKYGYSSVGAVVGATHRAQAEDVRVKHPHLFFLIPGYGAQGGKAEMLRCCFDENGLGGIVNNSRGILCAWQKRGGTYYDAARAACLDMQADLMSVLGEICAK